jgi:hypothetical protein
MTWVMGRGDIRHPVAKRHGDMAAEFCIPQLAQRDEDEI